MSTFNLFELVCLLLPIAAISGWYIGRRQSNINNEVELSSDYYVGLNFLLNEQTDKAIDAFIRMLDVSPDTVETTLALGNFFRRRGEVDRAIRIHQNLMTKPHLTFKQRSQALLELSQDYIRAGVYDRAESLLLEITHLGGDQLEFALRHLINIYEREKDWMKAIQVGLQLQVMSPQSMKREIAHYYCELAERFWSKGKIRQAFRRLRQALRCDKNCARVSLMQGNFEGKLGHFREALRAYERIEYQDVAFLPEALPMIIECYEKLGEKAALRQYLNDLMHHCPTISIALANAEHVKHQQGKEQAAHFLVNYMYKHPSIRGLKHLIEFHLARMVGEIRQEFFLLKTLVDHLLEKKPVYRCGQCGFASRLLHWQCPSCRQWASVKPIQGIEGE